MEYDGRESGNLFDAGAMPTFLQMKRVPTLRNNAPGKSRASVNI
jgi:hypothetical protein